MIDDTVCFKHSLYEFGSAWCVQMVPYFGFTIQLALLRVFNVKTKNLAFDTSKIITNACFLWRTSQFVVLVVCACIQNTIHLSIVLVLTFRVSKPIKFSLHFTNNIVPELTKRASFEVRKKNGDLVFIYREVFSRQ